MTSIKKLNAVYLICALLFCLTSRVKSEDSPVLDNLENYSNFEKWVVSGGPEASLFHSKEIAHSGEYAVQFKVKVNYSMAGDPKYPQGWLFLNRYFSPSQNWSDYKALEFYLYVPTNQPAGNIKYGIYCEDTKGETTWNNISDEDLKPGEWKKITLPLNNYAVKGSLTKVTKISFYIAESWYKDGDELNFYLDDFSLLKNSPASGNRTDIIYLPQTDYFPNEDEALVFRNLSDEPGKIADIKVALVDNNGKTVREDKIKIDPGNASFKIKIKDLKEGVYKMTADIEGVEGKILYSGEALLRKISRPFANSGESVPYVQGVSFYTKDFKQVNDDWINAVNKTPYQGIAVTIIGGYDVNPVPRYAELSSSIDKLKKDCKKQIWPWIFLNRLMGRAPGEGHDLVSHKSAPIEPYFGRIKGMDLYDEAGALSDFYALFRLALKTAKELKSPGIVLDHETYNNYKLASIRQLSQIMGRSSKEIRKKLRDTGKELADIAKNEYPEACIWVLSISAPDNMQSTDYIIYGLLDEAKQEKIPLKVIEGGEGSLGYVHKTEDELKHDIQKRGYKYSSLLLAYPDNFFLGGTISPTDKPEDRVSWIKNKYEGSNINKVEDLRPFFEDIFAAYKYVWIYAASAAKFDPFTSAGDRYHAVIQQAIDNVSKKNKHTVSEE